MCSSWLISFWQMLSSPRYHGWTVCGGRATCPPLQHRDQLVGQADELAAWHHVSVLWALWNSTGCQYCVQTGASWCWPPCSLLGSFCWRYKPGFSFTYFLHVTNMSSPAGYLSSVPISSRVSVLLPRAQSSPAGRSHPLPAARGCFQRVGQHHVGGVHKRQHYFGAVQSVSVHPAGLVVLPGD